MHLTKDSKLLPLFLSLTILAFVSSATALLQLTPTTFKDSTRKGLWFVEYFSPYCPHCRNFAPVWEKLVGECEKEIPEVHLAQVDCSAYGDLCSENGVNRYPTMLMYSDGKSLEEYKGKREVDDLKKFLKQQVTEATKSTIMEVEEPPSPTVNTKGEVLSINDQATFTATLDQGPTFVKFFAPWCGHCKRLAPIWVQLAARLKNKVTIAEVDCDAHGSLCAAQKIQGYPTLIYFSSGIRSEYAGGRKLDQMESFAENASHGQLHPLQSDSLLAQYIHEHDVVYLFLYSTSDASLVNTAREASRPLLGSPPVYASHSLDLFSRYGVPASASWALLAFKDHDSDKPTGKLHGFPNTSPESMKHWFMTHRTPSYLELSSDSFQTVMNAPQEPLVLIAATPDLMRDKVKSKVEQLAKEWKSQTGGSGEMNEKQVVFTWMDAEKWKDWLKSMYGIKLNHDQDDLDDIKVVLADHKQMVYYDEDSSGHKIKLTSPQLFTTLEKATAGKLHYKHSQNAVERLARYLNHKLTGVELYVTAHPFKSVMYIVGSIAIVFYLLFRWLGSDVPHERDYYKSSRLD